LLGVALLAPQALGGATPSTHLAILVAVFCVAGLAAWSSRRHLSTLGKTPIAIVAAYLIGMWTLVQALPMPCSWLAANWQERMEMMHKLVAVGGLDAPVCSISAAPGSTLVAAATAFALAALAAAAASVARSGGRSILVLSIALSSALMAGVAIVHAVSAADLVFGVYAPVDARPGLLLAPLLNANHLAGHIALGFPACISMALESKRVDAKLIWLAICISMFLTACFTLSRGGIAAVVAGGVGYLVFHFWRSRRRKTEASPLTLPVVILSCAGSIGAAAYFVTDLLAPELESLGSVTSKLTFIRTLWPLSYAHPWLGVGRGAFADLSPQLLPGNLRARFPENLIVQWISEWGAPLAVALAAAIVASLLVTRIKRDSEAALILGLGALALQNLVDFSLEIAGVAGVAAIAFGTLLGRERSPHWSRWPDLRAVLPIATATAGLCLLLALPWLTSRSRPALKSALTAQLGKSGGSFDVTLRSALKSYPLDPTLAVLGAAHAVRLDRKNAGEWLNLAMRLAPDWPSPHAQAAYWLERRGSLDQAAIELSLTLERDRTLGRELSCGFVLRHPSEQLAWSAAPAGKGQQAALEDLADCLKGPQPGVATKLARRMVELFPSSAAAQDLLVRDAVRRNDSQAAVALAQALVRSQPANPTASASLLFALTRTGRAREALSRFDQLDAALRNDRQVLLSAIEAAIVNADEKRLQALTDSYGVSLGQSASERAQLYSMASGWFAQIGDTGRALSNARASYDLTGDPTQLEHVHQLAKAAGMSQVALRAAIELCHVRHRGGTYCVPGAR
jgi:Flp pilus assembly protein TadD